MIFTQEIIWEEHNDLFVDEVDRDLIAVAGRVMGREMKKIAMRNDTLLSRIRRILTKQTTDPKTSDLSAIMVTYFDNTAEENLILLKEIKQGIEE